MNAVLDGNDHILVKNRKLGRTELLNMTVDQLGRVQRDGYSLPDGPGSQAGTRHQQGQPKEGMEKYIGRKRNRDTSESIHAGLEEFSSSPRNRQEKPATKGSRKGKGKGKQRATSSDEEEQDEIDDLDLDDIGSQIMKGASNRAKLIAAQQTGKRRK